jgi:FKBP-type peptidyl-prolyl cis-trans isomerase 2
MAGAANRVVAPGAHVAVHFTCRLPEGEVVASTKPSIADDPTQPKSPVFLVKNDSSPVLLIAGEGLESPGRTKDLIFEYAIADRLAGLVVGIPMGVWRTVSMTAEGAPVTAGNSKSVQLARVRVWAKEMRFTPDEFRRQVGSEPKVGEEYTYDNNFPGKVTAVTDTEVVVRFSGKPGATIRTAFGEGTIREMPDRYELPLDVKEGRLVRIGGRIGVISHVGEQTFTVDFSHPFGGKTLICDVLADPLPEAGKQISKE